MSPTQWRPLHPVTEGRERKHLDLFLVRDREARGESKNEEEEEEEDEEEKEDEEEEEDKKRGE